MVDISMLSAVSNVQYSSNTLKLLLSPITCTETISAMSTDGEGSTEFTNFVEPKESSSYHIGMRNWLAWISDVSKRYFTSMVVVVNPNVEILGSIASGELNAIEAAKTATAPSLFGVHVNPFNYYELLTVHNIYNGSTALEFHLLLLSGISGFCWALKQYHQLLISQDLVMEHQLICTGCSVKSYGTMLWHITFSQFLEYHLNLLECGGIDH